MTSNKLFLSILIPVFNVDKYIERCLDSIFYQTNEDCEVILVDDGSTDNSGILCEKYKDLYQEQCIVFHKENQGAYATRNFALNKAKGEYVWFIDPDDYIEDGAIKAIKDIIDSNKNVDIVTAAYKRFSDDWVGEIENNEIHPRIISGEEFLIQGYFREAYLWYHIYSRDFILKNNIIFNNELNTQGDWLFNAYAYVAATNIFISDKLIYNYFIGNPTSTLSRRDKAHLLRGVDNSIKAELAMSQLCKMNKDKSIYEPLMRRLSFTSSGFFYSLYRFNFPIEIIKNVIKKYKEHGLYPIKRCNNHKANLFIIFANCTWLYIFACWLRNFFNNK